MDDLKDRERPESQLSMRLREYDRLLERIASITDELESDLSPVLVSSNAGTVAGDREEADTPLSGQIGDLNDRLDAQLSRLISLRDRISIK